MRVYILILSLLRQMLPFDKRQNKIKEDKKHTLNQLRIHNNVKTFLDQQSDNKFHHMEVSFDLVLKLS